MTAPSRSRSRLAYVFERFPTYTQTFCIREVQELVRQGLDPVLFSIRDTSHEAVENCPQELRERVHVLPPEKELVAEVKRLKEARELPQSVVLVLRHWGERPDKMRVYEAAYIGHRLRQIGGGSIRVRHAHSHFAGVGARALWWLRRFHGVGYSFTGHANDLFCEPAEPVLPDLVRLLGDARFVATVSEHSGGWLRERFPGSAGRIHRVFNGLDLSAFPPNTDRALAAAGIGSGLVVSVGRLIEKKGFGDLISACALLRDRGIGLRCRIVGEGPLEGDLRKQIASLQLADRVELVGRAPSAEIHRMLLEEAHVFALPCVVESDGGMDNLPTVIMEAMAAGLPCVSTRLAGVPEMVDETGGRETGILTEPGDIEGTAAALERLLQDEDLACTMGRRGRARAEELFALPRTAGQLAGHFRRHCGGLAHLLRKRPAKVRDQGFDLVGFMGGT